MTGLKEEVIWGPSPGLWGLCNSWTLGGHFCTGWESGGHSGNHEATPVAGVTGRWGHPEHWRSAPSREGGITVH